MEFIIKILFQEFLEKATNSLLILTRYYAINPEHIDYLIVICSKDNDFMTTGITLIDTIKRELNKKLFTKLQPILPECHEKEFFMYISSFIKKIDAK